ncbi:hypothetical protein L1987_80328 [Smallanthus sonchifolius]|uniref:Uncharacterized protein n=1 Tax=Smallanthus sonchifolius TaxID=185202 RepID=A0ACB8YME3_9ASTR|nr:hypothetical protein L1987_80328 [Smallanthus sonchifolius]
MNVAFFNHTTWKLPFLVGGEFLLKEHILVLRYQSVSPSIIYIFQDIGRLHERGKEVPKATKLLTQLFPNKVTIHMPQDENLLASWKQHLDRDAETLKMNGNLNNLRNVLSRTGLECAEKIVGWTLSHHLMQHAKADPDARLVLSNESIQYGVEILQAIQNESKSLKKSLKNIVTENEFEKRLLADVIPPSDIGVTFNDIGALEKIGIDDVLKSITYE